MAMTVPARPAAAVTKRKRRRGPGGGSSLSAAGPAAPAGRRSVEDKTMNGYDILGRVLRAVYGLWIDTPPVLDLETYAPALKGLEANWLAIQGEALRLLDRRSAIPKLHELVKNQYDISDNDGVAWRYFVLRAFGRDQEANLAACPNTARLIRAVPEIASAGFSILDGGKYIPPHRGPYRGLLRYHLALLVPKDAAGNGLAVLRIDGLNYHWREGEGILWDETNEHEVWNRGDSPRIVLIVDVLRPGMPAPLRLIDRLLTRYIRRSSALRTVLEKGEVDIERGADDGPRLAKAQSGMRLN